jgi:hypothetical protein
LNLFIEVCFAFSDILFLTDIVFYSYFCLGIFAVGNILAMSTPTPPPPADTKAELQQSEVTHFEGKAANFITDNSQEVSSDANWTFWETVRYYWRAMAISFACGVCAMGDGYQYKMPGNIVALKGFIRQMGYLDEKTNTYVLNPQQVAAWGGKFNHNIPLHQAAQTLNLIMYRPGVYAGALVLVLLVGNWPVDRYGRKPALWAVQVFMIIAAIIEVFATNWTHWLAAKILNVRNSLSARRSARNS